MGEFAPITVLRNGLQRDFRVDDNKMIMNVEIYRGNYKDQRQLLHRTAMLDYGHMWREGIRADFFLHSGKSLCHQSEVQL